MDRKYNFYWELINAYGKLGLKPRRKLPLARSRHTCEDNTKINLKRESEDFNLINLAQGMFPLRVLVKTVANGLAKSVSYFQFRA
jgi:hypothetical protein